MKFLWQLFVIAVIIAFACSLVSAIELKESLMSKELQKIRYQTATFGSDSSDEFSSDGFEFNASAEPPASEFKHKSPGKAFLLSFLVPGAGQYYNDSKLKAAAFFGLEIAAWIFNRHYDSEGADIQALFEQFNRDNWDPNRYKRYLGTVYPDSDSSDIGIDGLHHLPSTRTQQYYEMTGKYDQFSWGWVDATLDGDSLDYLIGNGLLDTIRATGVYTIPYSDNRILYEQMRHDSNLKYKSARLMLTVAVVNHLLSGLEAFFAARKHNDRADKLSSDFARLSIKAKLRSFQTKRDTPFLQLSYKF